MQPLQSCPARCDLGPRCAYLPHPPDYLHTHACHTACTVSVQCTDGVARVSIADGGAGLWCWTAQNVPEVQVEAIQRWLDNLAYIDLQAVESRLVGWVRD